MAGRRNRVSRKPGLTPRRRFTVPPSLSRRGQPGGVLASSPAQESPCTRTTCLPVVRRRERDTTLLAPIGGPRSRDRRCRSGFRRRCRTGTSAGVDAEHAHAVRVGRGNDPDCSRLRFHLSHQVILQCGPLAPRAVAAARRKSLSLTSFATRSPRPREAPLTGRGPTERADHIETPPCERRTHDTQICSGHPAAFRISRHLTLRLRHASSPRCTASATTTSTSIASHKPPADPRRRWLAVISDRHFGIGADGLILICPQRAGRRPHADVQRRRHRSRDVRQRHPLRRQVSSTTTGIAGRTATDDRDRPRRADARPEDRRTGKVEPVTRRHGRADPRSRRTSRPTLPGDPPRCNVPTGRSAAVIELRRR